MNPNRNYIRRNNMSYIKAENVLPQELIETIQQYVDGKLIYIPCREKQEWGTTTSAKAFFRERNERIYDTYKSGMGLRELAVRFSLSEKSIQRILRDQKEQQ
jgi:Mor family transcriptional regulator